MGSVISAIFGGNDAPASDPAPAQETEEDKRTAKKSRRQLVANIGGATGSELTPGQVGRGNIFGN